MSSSPAPQSTRRAHTARAHTARAHTARAATRRAAAWLFVPCLIVATMAGCGALGEALGGTQTPTMSYQNAALINSPRSTSLVAYFCPSVAGATAAVACSPFGAAPAKEDLQFDFELTFLVDNPTSVPIPTLSMLLATSLFPDDDIQELGATCVQFCDPGDPACTGQAAEDACRADGQEVNSLEDFANAATDNLLDIATGARDPQFSDNIGIRTIPARGSQEMKVAFSLGVDPMTAILEKLAFDYVGGFLSGSEEPLEIPYDVRGTLWVDAPFEVGRFGLPFGPESAVWQLDL